MTLGSPPLSGTGGADVTGRTVLRTRWWPPQPGRRPPGRCRPPPPSTSRFAEGPRSPGAPELRGRRLDARIPGLPPLPGPRAVRRPVRTQRRCGRRRPLVAGLGGPAGGPTSADGLLVPATGTAGQVSSAFGTGLAHVRLASGAAAYLPTAATVGACLRRRLGGRGARPRRPPHGRPPPAFGQRIVDGRATRPAATARRPARGAGRPHHRLPPGAGPHRLQRRRRRRWRQPQRRLDPVGHRRALRVLDPLRPGPPGLRTDGGAGRARPAQRRRNRHLRAVLRHHHPGRPGGGRRGDRHPGRPAGRRGGPRHRAGGRPGTGQLHPHLRRPERRQWPDRRVQCHR